MYLGWKKLYGRGMEVRPHAAVSEVMKAETRSRPVDELGTETNRAFDSCKVWRTVMIPQDRSFVGWN